MIRSFEELFTQVKAKPKQTIAIAAAQDEDVLASAAQASMLDLADAVLIGDKASILRLCKAQNIDPDRFRICSEPDPVQAAQIAVQMARTGEARMVMKGLLSTADILRAVLHKDRGLRRSGLLSHVTCFEAPQGGRMMLMTDAAMNIAPTLDQKVDLIRNAAGLAQALGIARPKTAVIAAVETVNASMAATTEGALLAQMAVRGQIPGTLVDGPLALDNAVSEEAARHKGIGGPVAGQADILLMPDIEAGNVFYKALAYFSDTRMAGIVVGAQVPVVLTSRADASRTKLNSIALACWLGAVEA
jgi:phosphate butyryltransferase